MHRNSIPWTHRTLLYSKLLICSALQCTWQHCSPYSAQHCTALGKVFKSLNYFKKYITIPHYFCKNYLKSGSTAPLAVYKTLIFNLWIFFCSLLCSYMLLSVYFIAKDWTELKFTVGNYTAMQCTTLHCTALNINKMG